VVLGQSGCMSAVILKRSRQSSVASQGRAKSDCWVVGMSGEGGLGRVLGVCKVSGSGLSEAVLVAVGFLNNRACVGALLGNMFLARSCVGGHASRANFTVVELSVAATSGWMEPLSVALRVFGCCRSGGGASGTPVGVGHRCVSCRRSSWVPGGCGGGTGNVGFSIGGLSLSVAGIGHRCASH